MKHNLWDAKSQGKTENVFDCMVAEFLLSYGRSVPAQEVVMLQYGVSTLDELAEKQIEKFSKLDVLYKLFTEIELPFIEVLSTMEQSGITLDVKKLHTVGKEIDIAIHSCEVDLKKEFGDINLNSPIQVGDYLAEKAGVPLSKTKTGRYATNEGELSIHANQFPIIQQLLSYRELAKLRSTYVDSLITKVEGGRVHTTYSQIGASTGRLSSSNPNLQNIPVTGEFAQKIKNCFVAEQRKVLVSFDYSQQELRILAHLSGEEKLIEAFTSHRDVHTTTASQVFHIPYETVSKEQRSIAKTINFGIIYGMGSYGLSNQLGIPVEAAQKFINTFYATYPKIKTYFDQYLRDAKMNGYVETLLGRRRYVYEEETPPFAKASEGYGKFIDNATRRVLINYPIQGSAADLIRKAMVKIHQEIVSDECKLLLQIHDDLVFEMTEDKNIIEKIKTILCTIHPLVVPIEVDVKVGKSWGDMLKIRI